MKNTLVYIIESIVLLAISVALWQVMLIPVAGSLNAEKSFTLGENIYASVAFILLVVAILWYATKRGYINLREYKLNSNSIKWLSFAFIGTIVLHFIVQKIDPAYIDYSQPIQYYLVIDAMTTIFLSPIVEELVFRGILTKVIFPKNLILSLIVTGIIFAAIHVPVTFGEWINQLGAAFVLSLVYYQTRKIENAILAHIIMNLFLFVLYWIAIF